MPALFDMHAHEDTWNLLLQMAGGVTTSRDMGNDNNPPQEIISQLDAGRDRGSAHHPVRLPSRATVRTRPAAASV